MKQKVQIPFKPKLGKRKHLNFKDYLSANKRSFTHTQGKLNECIYISSFEQLTYSHKEASLPEIDKFAEANDDISHCVFEDCVMMKIVVMLVAVVMMFMMTMMMMMMTCTARPRKAARVVSPRATPILAIMISIRQKIEYDMVRYDKI